jgi:sugar phosphate permease
MNKYKAILYSILIFAIVQVILGLWIFNNIGLYLAGICTFCLGFVLSMPLMLGYDGEA